MKTFAEHLKELKTRLLKCFILFTASSILGFCIHKSIESIIQKPLNQTLYYTNPAGGLSFAMQISLSVGVIITLPLLLFQLVQFARPAIKPIKTKIILVSITCSMLLAVGAIVYAYFLSLPSALHFLTTFNSGDIKALISISDYLKFIFAYLAGTVVAFQIPLIMFFTNKIRRFPPGGLLKLQRPAIVGSIIFAGIITPTVDPMNQLLIALPIIALFEVGALTVVINNKFYKPLPTFEIKRPAVMQKIVIPMPNAPVAKQSFHVPAVQTIESPSITSYANEKTSVKKRIISDIFIPATS